MSELTQETLQRWVDGLATHHEKISGELKNGYIEYVNTMRENVEELISANNDKNEQLDVCRENKREAENAEHLKRARAWQKRVINTERAKIVVDLMKEDKTLGESIELLQIIETEIERVFGNE